MSTAPLRPAGLLDEIAQVLRRELASVERMPLPLDDDAESQLVAGVLDGSVSHDDLAPLAGEHFGIPFLGDVYRLSADTKNPTDIASALREQGYSSTAIAEVYCIQDSYPSYPTPRYQQMAHRVVELWRRRQLTDVCRVVADSMAFDLSFIEAVDLLRETIVRVRHDQR